MWSFNDVDSCLLKIKSNPKRTLLVFLILIVLSQLPDKNTAITTITMAYAWCIRPDTVELPRWLELLICMTFATGLFYLTSKVRAPKWKAYTEENFAGLLWRWEWFSATTPWVGHISPEPYCLKCDHKMDLISDEYAAPSRLRCLGCSDYIKMQVSWDQMRKMFQAHIEKKIRDKSYLIKP